MQNTKKQNMRHTHHHVLGSMQLILNPSQSISVTAATQIIKIIITRSQNYTILYYTIHTFARGTFKSTRTNTFFPLRSTFLASPSTFNFSQHDDEAWKFRRKAAVALLLLRLKNFVVREENSIVVFSFLFSFITGSMKDLAFVKYCVDMTDDDTSFIFERGGSSGLSEI